MQEERPEAHDRRVARAAALATAAALVAALVPLFPRYFVHWDEVQLRLAVERVDLVWHQPHAPGYYVYVLLARLVRALAPASLEPGRVVSVLAAAGFALVVGLRLPAGLAPGPRALLLLAPLAFVLGTSLVRFFAVSHLTYLPEGAAWVGLLLLAATRPRGPALWASAGLVGVAGGLRQTLLVWSALLCAGLWLRDRSWIRPRDLAPAGLALLLGIALWLVPMLVETGGLATYLEATRRICAGAIWSKSVFVHPSELLGRGLLMLGCAVSSLGWIPAALLAARALERRPPGLAVPRASDGSPLLLAGAALAFGFYALLIYDSAGYAMSFVLPAAAWGILEVSERAARLDARRATLLCVALLGSVLASGRLGALSDYSLAATREHDARLRERFEAVATRFDPETTLLVTSTENRRWGFRHVMYYLPGYATLQLRHDSFFVRATAVAPYLTARDRRVWVSGPEGLDLAQLASFAAPQRLERVVYMVPGDAERFVGASCAPWLERLETAGGEVLWDLRVSPALAVHVRDERLECRSGSGDGA